MGRKKKNVETPVTIVRDLNPLALEKRVFNMDNSPRRSWDLFALEERIFQLEKNGGGGYGTVVNTIPKYTASAKSSYSQDIWAAFDHVANSDFRNPNDAWTSEAETPYIMVEYDNALKVTAIDLYVFSNYSGDFTGTIKIQGSNDGETFVDLTDAITITAELETLTKNSIEVNATDAYKYIRILGSAPFSVAYQPSCYFDQVNIMGVF